MNVLVHAKLLGYSGLPKVDLLHEPIPFLCAYVDDEEITVTPSYPKYYKNVEIGHNFYFETTESDEHLSGILRIEVHDARLTDSNSLKLIPTDESFIGYYEFDLCSLEGAFGEYQEGPLTYLDDKRGRKLAKAGKNAAVVFQVLGYTPSFENYAEKFADNPDVILDTSNRRFFVPIPYDEEMDLGLFAGLSFPHSKVDLLGAEESDEDDERDDRVPRSRRGRQRESALRSAPVDVFDTVVGSCSGVQLLVASTAEGSPFEDIDVCFELPERRDEDRDECSKTLRATYFQKPKRLCKGLKAYFIASLLNLPLDVPFNKVRLYLTARRAVGSVDLMAALEQCGFPGADTAFPKALRDFSNALRRGGTSSSQVRRGRQNESGAHVVTVNPEAKAVYLGLSPGALGQDPRSANPGFDRYSSESKARQEREGGSSSNRSGGREKGKGKQALDASLAGAPQIALIQVDYSGMGDFRGSGIPIGASTSAGVSAGSSGKGKGQPTPSPIAQLAESMGGLSLAGGRTGLQGFFENGGSGSSGGDRGAARGNQTGASAVTEGVFSPPLALRIAVVPEAETAGYVVDYVSVKMTHGAPVVTLTSRLAPEVPPVKIAMAEGGGGSSSSFFSSIRRDSNSGANANGSGSGGGEGEVGTSHWVALLNCFPPSDEQRDGRNGASVSAGTLDCGVVLYSLADEPTHSWRFSSLLKPPKSSARATRGKKRDAETDGASRRAGTDDEGSAKGGKGGGGINHISDISKTALRGIGGGFGLVATGAKNVFNAENGRRIASGVNVVGGFMKRGFSAVTYGVKDIGSKVQQGVETLVETDTDEDFDPDASRAEIEDVEEVDELPESTTLQEKYRYLQERYRGNSQEDDDEEDYRGAAAAAAAAAAERKRGDGRRNRR